VTGLGFSPDTAVSFTNKTEILLKVALNTIKKPLKFMTALRRRHVFSEFILILHQYYF
jgi:hypothetical protein